MELSDYSSYTLDNVCQNNLTDTTPKETYKVYFYMDNNYSEIYKTIDVEEGNYVDLPQEPTLDGFIFKEWLDENDLTFNSNTLITNDIRLYAKWEKVETNNDLVPDDNTDNDGNGNIQPEPDDNTDNDGNGDIQPEPDDNTDNTDNGGNTNTDDNPETGDNLYLVLLTCLSSLIVSMYFYKMKLNVVDNKKNG